MTEISEATRDQVWRRAGSRCERCGVILRRRRDNTSVHHRRPRGLGGSSSEETNLPSNLLLLCGDGTSGCHGWVERNRVEARQGGLLLHQGDAPTAIPVKLAAGWTLLGELGDYRGIPEEEWQLWLAVAVQDDDWEARFGIALRLAQIWAGRMVLV